MPEDVDVVLRRYTEALSRWWWLIAGVAVLVGTVYAVAGADRAFGGSHVLLTRVAVLDPADLYGAGRRDDRLELSSTLNFRALTDLMASSSVRAEVADELGFEPTVTVRGLDAAKIIEFTVRSDDEDAVYQASDAYVAALRGVRSRDISEVIRASTATLDARFESIEGSIGRLDGELLALTPEQAETAFSVALQAERQRLISEREEIDASRASLEVVATQTDGAVAVIDTARSASSSTTGGPIRFIFGMLAGGVLCTAAVTAFTVLDRRVRSASDVERITGHGSVLDVLDGTGRLAPLVVGGLAQQAQGRPIHVVGAGRTDTGPVCAALANQLGGEGIDGRIVDGGSIGDRSSRTAANEDRGPVVVATKIGRTSQNELAEAVRQVRSADVPFLGVILVPTRIDAAG